MCNYRRLYQIVPLLFVNFWNEGACQSQHTWFIFKQEIANTVHV